MKKPLTIEQKRKRALYQKRYREENPEYVARYRQSAKPHLDKWRKATERKKKERIIRDYIREGMIIEGWKIEITHVYREKVQINRKMISEENMFDSHNQVLRFTFEQMLDEFGL